MPHPASHAPLPILHLAAGFVILALTSTTPSLGNGAALRPLDDTPRVIAPFDAPQEEVDTIALPAGGFVVVFHEGFMSGGVILPEPPVDGRDGSLEGIVAQLLDSDGKPFGEPWVVNVATGGPQTHPALAADSSSGGFSVAWLDHSLPRMRRYDSLGHALTDEIVITDDTAFWAERVAIATNPDGDSLVVWRDLVDAQEIQVVPVSNIGTVGDRVTIGPAVLPARVHEPHVAALPSGDFFVAWPEVDSGSIHGQRFDADGSPLGAQIEFGTFWTIEEMIVDPSGLSDRLHAVIRERPPQPPRWLVLDPETGTVVVHDLDRHPDTNGALPRLVGAAPDCIFTSIDQEPRLRTTLIHSADTTGQTAERFVELDASGYGGVELAADPRADGSVRVLAAWTPFDERNVRIATMVTDTPRLLLGDGGRFAIEATWRDFEGVEGSAIATPIAADTGAFWFFDPANLEVTVKVLDGRDINGHFWVFNGSLSNVEYTLTVTDQITGAVYTFTNPLGQFGSFGDTEALPGT
ncbi:MAG: hypothetical protein AAGE94_02260 [Acidobacteriota bacterium]